MGYRLRVFKASVDAQTGTIKLILNYARYLKVNQQQKGGGACNYNKYTKKQKEALTKTNKNMETKIANFSVRAWAQNATMEAFYNTEFMRET
jgi:hypothetical protein